MTQGLERKIAIARAMARDPLYFGRLCVPEMFKVRSPDFHATIAKVFLNLLNKAISLIAPRGHAKSSLVACIFVLWHIFLEDYYRYLNGFLDRETQTPEVQKLKQQFKAYEAGAIKHIPHRRKYVVIVSKVQKEAIGRMKTIKEVLGEKGGINIGSKLLKVFFGDYSEYTALSWTGEKLVLADGTMLEAVGTGQQVRGKKNVHLRVTLYVVDDPEDEENTKTSERMLANMEWLKKAVMPGLDMELGRCIVIGTPLNTGCMVVKLDSNPQWKSLQFTNDLKSNQLLWPWYIGQDYLQKKYDESKADGRLSQYYMEYEAKVIGSEDQIFKREYLQYWTGSVKQDINKNFYLEITGLAESDALGKCDYVKYEKPKEVPINIFMGMDPAASTSSRADYTVIMVIGVDADLNRYCIDMWRRRERAIDVVDEMIRLYKRYNPFKTYVESNGFQSILAQEADRRMREENIWIPGLQAKNTARNQKDDRLEGMQPEFARRMVYLHALEFDNNRQAKTVFDPFIDELSFFPRTQHDDCLDAYWYARKRVVRPDFEIVKVKEKKEIRRRYIDWRLV